MTQAAPNVTVAHTPRQVREAVLELLKYGAIEAARKPNIYRTLTGNRTQLDRILDPLGFQIRLDEMRGLAFVVVPKDDADEAAADEADEWLHPLVRRARLTLEQSLLVAILRQQFIGRELEVGLGVEAISSLDDILPLLRDYLGDLGSDQQEDKRARNLMEQLRVHGIASEIDQDGRFVIRPMIVHLASPEHLEQLLRVLQKAGNEGTEEQQGNANESE